MDWFTLALVSIPLLSLSWLSLKKAQQSSIPHTYTLGLYFLVNAIIIAAWLFLSGKGFKVPTPLEAGLFVFSSVATACSNLLMMHSFERSPNPGISVALLSTQSVWLTFISTLLFGTALGWGSAGGVLLVVTGVALVHLKGGHARGKWVFYCLLAGVLNASMWLGLKGIQTVNPSYGSETLLLYVLIPQIVLYFIIGQCKRHRLVWNRNVLKWSVGGGIINSMANLAIFGAVIGAPNPGVAHAITSSNVLLTLVVAPFLTNATLNRKQALATVLIVAGIVIIRLTS
jgi:drug/metabolite transporter (DMT)-like permease